ncbi:MAG: hypothetical protein OK457_10290 [Thaumarchaeota archaeon]|nr:hypothetical protein [Nitrososphaerota archaeon]
MLDLIRNGSRIRTEDSSLAFYNMNIDAIAMPCPICEEAEKKFEALSSDHLRLFQDHLNKSHGMTN